MDRFNSGGEYAEVSDVAQISRPFQIALGAVALLGLVWMMALRGHGPNPSEPAPSTPAKTPAKTVAQANPGAPTPIYRGAAPGVEGLTRAIAKAHGAVATSQRNAQELQNKSSAASNEAQAQSPSVHVVVKTAPSAAQATKAAALVREAAARRHAAAVSKAKRALPSAQVAVEHELAQGKTVMLVFWNPNASVDREVQAQARALVAGSKGTVTMHGARANQVGTFGSITEVAHVYQTPTILIVNKRGVVSTLTGLTDVFSLKQAVHEARLAGH